MKAMVLRELGGPLRLEEVPIPAPGPGEVRVRVRATGVGLTVVIMTANPGLVTSFPRIPGHEVAGDVVDVGPGVQGENAGERGGRGRLPLLPDVRDVFLLPRGSGDLVRTVRRIPRDGRGRRIRGIPRR